ncbi:inosine-uridine preferring nucleoside hydrolase [Corynebacterium diphtheriae]|nr:inosine-uridine preferring nucleoside hydrolase [Corynebacterium diphtheriae]CAB0717423.1 inosine-uridine preferring nucleoside hydrolase [Corynebacterium diphtheriae]CAB0828489.1 inosine-uridine preferring nucleoside hydrolase [Corynebacterium diphtheriae]
MFHVKLTLTTMLDTMNSSAHRPVVVADVDTGIDDALAITYLGYLHRRGLIELRITTSAGNCTAEQAAANSAEIMNSLTLSDVPITPGAPKPRALPLTTTPETHGPTGLGYHTTRATIPQLSNAAAAVDLWKGADYLLVAGPATNVAWAAENAPEVLNAIPHVTFMTGAFHYPGNTTPTAEWNAWVDPHALKEALAHYRGHAVRPTICPLNVTESVLLTPQRLKQWCQRSQEPVLPILSDALRFYFEFHESVGVGYMAQIHDLAAAMVLLHRVPHTTRPGFVDVEADAELTRGTTVVDWDSSYGDHPANAQILTALQSEDVFAEFERVVLEY